MTDQDTSNTAEDTISRRKVAVIIGAGPAGLTAAYELLKRTDVIPIVFEATEQIGGIAQTVNHNGNRIDIGGHRFFSKSDRVMDWWQAMIPLQRLDGGPSRITYHQQDREIEGNADGPDPEKAERVMLVRERTSRIYYLRKFFAYPVTLSPQTLLNLGPVRTVRIGISYIYSMMFPIKNESNLEEFFINRFGRELYGTFFKSYTEKVWGVACTSISAEWGAQRIKGLSIVKAIAHNLKQILPKSTDIAQKDVETSLIEQFLYPKYGPGQMWEVTAQKIEAMGGEVHMKHPAVGLHRTNNHITGVEVKDLATGEVKRIDADYVFSTMPVKELVRAIGDAPEDVLAVSDGLVYRDFMTVGLLVRKLKSNVGADDNGLIPDNWIYIQEPEVRLGRLQIFNNWSPYMVAQENTVWLGLEYFCDEGDDLWSMSDEVFAEFAAKELDAIDVIEKEDVIDYVVIRMPKTYPAYFGTYDQFDTIRSYVDPIENLFLVGRNGMHKYNNQDHSMLTAMVAVDNIAAGIVGKENIWEVNTEMEYHEEK